MCTGHAQFYEKFTFRRHIAQLLLHLRARPEYHRAMVQLSKRVHSFVPFVHMLLNDANYLLDETLRQLQAIHETEVAMGQPEWARMPQEERDEREREHSQTVQYTRQMSHLANLSVDLLQYLTE